MSASKPARRPELDALRGLFLVLMVAVHLPTQVSDWANQPIGFISAAEGFVGLSALLAGRIYFGKIYGDEGDVWRKLWKRALKIYSYQLILLALLFTIAAAVAVDTHRTAILNLLTFYIAHPARALIGSVALVYCPPLFDILPMYIIFLFLTPLLLSIARRIGWGWILGASAALWLGAQFGVREAVDHWISHVTGLNVPLAGHGAFNLFAWQSVWVLGLWFGASSAVGEIPLHKLPRWTVALSVAVCGFFLCVRHGWLGPHWNQQSFGMELDKWQLGPLRVLNIAAYIVLFWWLRKYIAKALTHEPMVVFGQASIEVFCGHLFFVFLGLGLVTGDLLHASGPAAVTLDIITFPALFAMAYWIVKRRKRRKGVPEPRREIRPKPIAEARPELRQKPTMLAAEANPVAVREE